VKLSVNIVLVIVTLSVCSEQFAQWYAREQGTYGAILILQENRVF
jgi:hypothetical protein